MSKNGNVIILSTIIIAAILIIFFFIILIFVSETNALLYNMKLDMYSINKSAILSVNKGITSRGSFSYDTGEYREYFEKMLMANYKLNEDLENEDGAIQKVNVLQYSVEKAGKKDKYTKKKLKDNTIHSVIEVKVKPILNIVALEDLFVFEIHEDVSLNVLEM